MKPSHFISGLLLAAVSSGAYAEDMLAPGASKLECGISMLDPGLIKPCNQAPRPKTPPAREATTPRAEAPKTNAQPVAMPAKKRDLEAEIEEYRKNYGKPPAEAIRAMLNPTDENIQALVEYNQRREALARYMSQRMTEIQARAQQADRTEPEKSGLTAIDVTGIKIRYYFAINCTYCAAQTPMLQSLSSAYPQLDIEGIESSGANSFQVIEYARKTGATFAMRRAQPGEIRQLSITGTPTLFVQDKTAANSVQRLDGLQSLQQITAAIKTLRNKK